MHAAAAGKRTMPRHPAPIQLRAMPRVRRALLQRLPSAQTAPPLPQAVQPGRSVPGPPQPPGNNLEHPLSAGGKAPLQRWPFPRRSSPVPTPSLCILLFFFFFMFSLQRVVLQSIRPVVLRKQRGFSVHFGPGGAVLPPRILRVRLFNGITLQIRLLPAGESAPAWSGERRCSEPGRAARRTEQAPCLVYEGGV